MVNLALALAAVALCLFFGAIFLCWILWQWWTARKYRHLLKLYAAMPPKQKVMPGPSFAVTIKNGKKSETLVVEAKTEGEAIKNLLKQGISYDKVIKLEKRT